MTMTCPSLSYVLYVYTSSLLPSSTVQVQKEATFEDFLGDS